MPVVQRKRRAIFDALAMVSALLSVAISIFWVRGGESAISVGSHYTTLSVAARWNIRFSLWKYTFDPNASTGLERPFIRFSEDNWTVPRYGIDEWRAGNFGVARISYLSGSYDRVMIRRYTVAVPYWFAVSVFATITIFCAGWRRRQRHLPGHCSSCGYDLRATPQRCPECGHVPAEHLALRHAE